jgi:hypothetical protein
MTDPLREALADQEHERWSGWMSYMLSLCERTPDAGAIIPPAQVSRWERQMTADYDQLSEREKDSDRAEADKTLTLIRAVTNRKGQAVIVRAKFVCHVVQPYVYGGTEIVLHPVTDGSEEDKSFWAATPSGEIKLIVNNEAAVKHFEPGRKYYVDFAPAE